MGERNLQEQGKNGWRGSGRRGEGTLGHGQKEEKEGRGKGKKERMNQIVMWVDPGHEIFTLKGSRGM